MHRLTPSSHTYTSTSTSKYNASTSTAAPSPVPVVARRVRGHAVTAKAWHAPALHLPRRPPARTSSHASSGPCHSVSRSQPRQLYTESAPDGGSFPRTMPGGRQPHHRPTARPACCHCCGCRAPLLSWRRAHGGGVATCWPGLAPAAGGGGQEVEGACRRGASVACMPWTRSSLTAAAAGAPCTGCCCPALDRGVMQVWTWRTHTDWHDATV